MSENSGRDDRYEWQIVTADATTRYTGRESPATLGNLFAMWVQHQGDISDWQNAGQFGAIIVEYSDLTLSQVAALLGIEQDNIWSANVPDGDPPWGMSSPAGADLTINHKKTANIT